MSKPTEPQAPKKSLVTKLAEVMGEVGRIAKTGRNNFHNYDYATEADIVESCRGGMAERGLMLIPSVAKTEWRTIQAKSGPQTVCTLTVDYELLDGDSDQKIKFTILGEGQDQGDKATYKALTGATKYALLKLFLIPTGDDPERDDHRQPTPKLTPPAQNQPQAAGRRAAETKTAARSSRVDTIPANSPAGRAMTQKPAVGINPHFDLIRELGKKNGKIGPELSSWCRGVGITKTDPTTFTDEDVLRVASSFEALKPPRPASAAPVTAAGEPPPDVALPTPAGRKMPMIQAEEPPPPGDEDAPF